MDRTGFALLGALAMLVFGVHISFRDHARVGIPVTLATLLVLAGWMLLAGI